MYLNCEARDDTPKLAARALNPRVCLKAALINVDTAVARSKHSFSPDYYVAKLTPTTSSSPASSASFRHVSHLHLRQYLHTQHCSRRTYHQTSPSLRFADKSPSGPSFKNTPKQPKSSGGYLRAAEDAWLQPSDELSSIDAYTSEWDSSNDPSVPPRFDWRKRAPSRLGIPLSTPEKRKKYPRRKLPVIDPISPGEPYFEAIENYGNHFLPLLEHEEAEDRQVITERLSTWSKERLKEEGYCITDLSGYWLAANQYGKPVAAFQYGPGLVLPKSHKFENGMQIMLSRADPVKEEPHKGSIVEMTETQIKVAFPSAFDAGEGTWRMDVDQMNLIFERMRKAISYLHYDPSKIEQYSRSPDQQHILLGTGLRDVLLRSNDFSRISAPIGHDFHALQAVDDVSYPRGVLSHDVRGYSHREFEGAFKEDMRVHSWAQRNLLETPLNMEGDPGLSHMNRSQVKAMASMIGNRISLVQGPPGTGKTKTIIETIKLLKIHFEVPHPLMVCTYTNVAVDNLVEGFIKAGLKPLRVGYAARIKPSLVEHSLDYQLTQHPLQSLCKEAMEELRKLEEDIDDLGKRLRGILNKVSSGNTNKALKTRVENMYKAMAMMDRKQGQLKGKIYGLQQEMLHDIVQNADVVCTTCISSASTALGVCDFPVVFIDEASMSTEPATLIPIMKGSRHLALIGDHKQLPPVITSQEAKLQGLGVSLFERLTEEGIVPSVMLDIQYRMHPAISCFPSLEFYNNTIQDGTKDKEGNVMDGLEPPMSTTHLLQQDQQSLRPSVIFLDHYGYESMSGRSRVNHHEAQIVVSLVEDLLLQNPKLRGQDIGIIAPYVSQIKLLTRMLNTESRYLERYREVLGHQRCRELIDVEVKTVDGFEGREKEVIIFSTVRNNDNGNIGFLADRRRLNVGLTRAKRGLFVVGSMKTIGGPVSVLNSDTGMRGTKGQDSWKRYAEWLGQEGLVLKLVGENLQRTLYGNLKLKRREVN